MAEENEVFEEVRTRENTRRSTNKLTLFTSCVTAVRHWFGRVVGFLKDETNLCSRCVSTASPDRASALVLFLILVAIALTCVLCRYLLPSEFQLIANNAFELLIICFEVVGALCLALIMFLARTQPARTEAADTNLQPWHRVLRKNIQLFGIVPFYFAIFVFGVFLLIANTNCWDSWIACMDERIRFEYIGEFLYPIARSAYLFVEMLFCVKNNARHFVQNTLVLCGLAVIQATNLFVWLDAITNENEVFSRQQNRTNEIWSCFNGSVTINESDYLVQCFARTTPEFKLLMNISPYLYPFIIEYLMLMVECVADWFFRGAHHTEPQRHGDTALSSEVSSPQAEPYSCEPTRDGTVRSMMQGPSTHYGSTDPRQPQQSTTVVDSSDTANDDHHEELMPLLDEPTTRASQSTARSFQVVNNGSVPAAENWFNRCPWLFVFIVLAVFGSILFVIFSVCNFFIDTALYMHLFMSYRTGCWVMLLLAALTGYIACRHFPLKQMNPTGFEYFVILSSVGAILQCTFTVVVSNMDSVSRVGFLVESLATILQIFVQTVFYVYAKSVQIRTEGEEADERGELYIKIRRKRSVLIGVISIYAVFNIALWVDDSFIETRSSEKGWQAELLDSWPVIYNILNPLTLLFRFNSVLLFLVVLFDKKH